MLQIAIFGMVAIAAGGVAYVFLYPMLSGQRKTEQRMKAVSQRSVSRANLAKASDNQNRRRQVQDSLKNLENEQKTKKKKYILRDLIAQADVSISVKMFYILSAVSGLVVALLSFFVSQMPIVIIGAFMAGTFGLPRWVLGFLRSRRQKKFLEEFPNAIDIIVRGVKAGLPFNDTIRMIASESAEPVRSEFRDVVESQAIGLTIAEGLQRVYGRMPLPEMNFLTIVISIQSQSGGNLADALGNLSRVLRERKKIQGKIRAMSQEAKSSAAIIASLPFVVMMLVYITTPHYISLLWEEQTGQLMMLGSAIWMSLGVLVMKKMINFDF
ncbi:MAG: type II secretion system F family protein [Rhizobiales bacterium]|nr:type II secretion system F family protein [Hyphomicrobiales bacterium]